MQVSADLLAAIKDAHCPMRFVVEYRDSAVVLSVGGEVDMSNVVLWQRLLREVVCAAGKHGVLIVDANGLTFMGGCAYAALAQQARQCRRRGIELRLVSGQSIAARLLSQNGWGTDLPLYPDLCTALAADAPVEDIGSRRARLSDGGPHTEPYLWLEA